MSYTERNWKPTAILVCEVDGGGKLDKTAKEIIEALDNDYIVMVKSPVYRLKTTEVVGVKYNMVGKYNLSDKTISTEAYDFTYEEINDYPVADGGSGPVLPSDGDSGSPQ